MKSVLIYSGGLDSTVLLHKLAKENSIVQAVSFNYGQKQIVELEYAKKNCKKLNVKHSIIDLTSIKDVFAQSALINPNIAVPKASYEKENMAVTVVPNRNMIFLSIAAALAISNKATHVAYAAHAGDHAVYADCTDNFASAMEKALYECDWSRIKLYSPFVNLSKIEIAKLGISLGVDFDLTWSCYEGTKTQCKKCATCIERNDAISKALKSS